MGKCHASAECGDGFWHLQGAGDGCTQGREPKGSQSTYFLSKVMDVQCILCVSFLLMSGGRWARS